MTHPHLKVERVIKIRADFTAEDWQLYSDEKHLYASVIASRLNRQLEDYVNRGETRAEVTRFMHSLMRHHAVDGAHDTEPMAFLERVLDQIYAS
jgi:hypothetical protein